MGHLINDGALPQLDETNVPSDFPEIVEQYWDESEAAVRWMMIMRWLCVHGGAE